MGSNGGSRVFLEFLQSALFTPVILQNGFELQLSISNYSNTPFTYVTKTEE